jgi:outer membrane lipoprotein-sorting protein
MTLLAMTTAGQASTPAGTVAAADILRHAEEIRSPKAEYAVEFMLRTVNPASSWKERTSRYTMIARGKDDAMILMRYPTQFYPGTLLMSGGAYWFLLPRADKPLQLSEHQILEGDISYGDLARGNLLHSYEARLDGEETLGDSRCWRLELTRTSSGARYARVRCWIEKKSYRPRRFEYYGMTGALLKTAIYTEYDGTRLGLRPARVEVTSPSRPDETTTLLFTELRPLDLSRVSFTTEGLHAFRNAALDCAGDAQARVEDVVARLGRAGS